MKQLIRHITLVTALFFVLNANAQLSKKSSIEEPVQIIKNVGNREIKVEDLDQFIQHVMDSLEIPGLSIAIINNAEVAYHKKFGVTNIENGKKVDNQTIFEAASLSKPAFAYFAMKMVEKGILDLDKPVNGYLPHPGIEQSSQKDYEIITPRMILSHSTGFPNWSHGEKIKLSHKPGNGYSYSGEAYQYLAAIIGMLNNVGWEDRLDSLFQEEVAKPLGLSNSFFTWNDHIALHKATGYQNDQPTDPMEHGKSFGAGYSLHTESADYAKFLIEMMQGNHLSKELVEEMLSEQNKFDTSNELLQQGQTGWGLGFARRPTVNGIRYMHTGNNHDFQAYCCFYNDRKFGLVFFINSDKIEPFYSSLGKYLEDEF